MSKTSTITARPELARKLGRIGFGLSILVLALVGIMRSDHKIPLPEGVSTGFIPPVMATINTLVSVFLILALFAIKRRNILVHQRFINAAMIGSIVFLLFYVAYHFTTGETKFGGEGMIRKVYFFLLITHIILAAISLPMIVQTWVLGFCGMVDRHRKWTRIVFPIWLYVAITGPICYLMLRPYY